MYTHTHTHTHQHTHTYTHTQVNHYKKTTHFEHFDLRLLQQFYYNTHLKFLILYIQFFNFKRESTLGNNYLYTRLLVLLMIASGNNVINRYNNEKLLKETNLLIKNNGKNTI